MVVRFAGASLAGVRLCGTPCLSRWLGGGRVGSVHSTLLMVRRSAQWLSTCWVRRSQLLAACAGALCCTNAVTMLILCMWPIILLLERDLGKGGG